eukprot:571031-Rhodomonas_salina.5
MPIPANAYGSSLSASGNDEDDGGVDERDEVGHGEVDIGEHLGTGAFAEVRSLARSSRFRVK